MSVLKQSLRVMSLVLVLGLFAGAPALAQTVDPCGYGCPKEGCNCPDSGGGPINSSGDDGK